MAENTNTLEVTLKQSALSARDDYDYRKLVNHGQYLIPCTYRTEDEEITFSFDMKNLKPLSSLKKENKKNKYDFLVNFAALEGVMREYKAELSEENLYYDENFMPFIKVRDIYDKGEKFDMQDFVYQYKCFAAGLIGGSKYSVGQIQASGIEAVKHDKVLEDIINLDTPEEIADKLRAKRAALVEYMEKTELTVSRGKFAAFKYTAIIAVVLTILLGAGTIYLGMIELPYEKAVKTASQAFIGAKYTQCIDSLADYEVDRLDIETKYILAVSYARSESFKKEEIRNIIDKLSQASSEQEMEYWIYLGRNQLAEAQNTALTLSDDKLLIYAYMKEIDAVENDIQMDGNTKQERLTQLQNSIESIGKKYITDAKKDEEK